MPHTKTVEWKGYRVARGSDPNGWRYTAWEPGDEISHQVHRTEDGEDWGRVDTRRPEGDRPEDAVEVVEWATTWQLKCQRIAYGVICAAFPEAPQGFQCRGEILLLGDPLVTLQAMERKKRGKTKGTDEDPDIPAAGAGPGGLAGLKR